MTDNKNTSRREFFARGAHTAAILSFGGVTAKAAAKAGAIATPLSSYRPVSTFATGAKVVRGLAVAPDDSALVVGDRAVVNFSPEGREIRRYALDAEPICAAASICGRVFAGCSDHIEVFRSDGSREAVWTGLGEGVSLTSLAVSHRCELFASDGGNRVIWHLDSNGAVIRRIDRDGDGFAVPRDFFPVAVKGDDIVVANLGRHRIETFDRAGKLVSHWGERSRTIDGFGGCCNPVSLAVTSDGQYVTAEGGLPRIKIYGADGKFKELVAGPEELEANARGSHENTADLSGSCHSGGLEVAVDSQHRIFALDRVTAEVRIFARA